ERFHPQRIVSVHAHSIGSVLGDAPGVFVDPRGINPRTGRPDDPNPTAATAAAAADDALTQSLFSKARDLVNASRGVSAVDRSRAFAGHVSAGTTGPANVHYPST